MKWASAAMLRLAVVALLLISINVAAVEADRGHIAVIGGGYAGLTASLELRALGYSVTVFESRKCVGGRARVVTSPDGSFTFDAGPSWWWMPDVYNNVLARYGRTSALRLTRLDPAYRVVLPGNTSVSVPGSLEGLLKMADELDAHNTLRSMFAEASQKYQAAVREWLWKPMTSPLEVMAPELAMKSLQWDMLGSFEAHVRAHTSSPLIRTLLKWPVIFIGASPRDAPALYSLMAYAGHALGTWYPEGGMAAPARELAEIARDLGVDIRTSHEVVELQVEHPGSSAIRAVCTKSECVEVSGVVASADYHHIEQTILPTHLRRYSPRYWRRRQLSPACVLFFLGLSESLPSLAHHTFFFDRDLDHHLSHVFDYGKHSDAPTFYVTAAARSAPPGTVAPVFGDALFVLVPMAFGLNGTDTPSFRAALLEDVLDRLEARAPPRSGERLRSILQYNASYGSHEFAVDFNAFRGNAFGVANVLSQSLVLKPSMASLASNMVFAGHMTNPGPGVPPSLLSGIVAATLLDARLESPDQTGWLWTAVALGGIALVVCHVVGAVILAFSPLCASYARCVWLFYCHGRTYFAASTLFDPIRFIDTAAMYALFRVSDDIVDVPSMSSEQKREMLESFKRSFWSGFDDGVGCYAAHPVFPAVVHTIRRRKYERESFATFFTSMEMDIDGLVCATFDDTWKYMKGSAAVIGDVMLPLLVPALDEEARSLRKHVLPHARDLGRAFQLTNMVRDINEDLTLGREYVPRSVCKKHSVSLARRDALQSGWDTMVEEVLSRAEACYVSADKGIAMLPSDVRPALTAARVMYSYLHTVIRTASYDVFNGRLQVPLWQKFALVSSHVPATSLVRMIAVEVYAVILYLVVLYAASATLVMLLSVALRWSNWWMPCTLVSYAGFHCVVTTPVTVAAWTCALTVGSKVMVLRSLAWTAVLAVVAFLYTTPWDNYLVYRGVWSYGAEPAVLGVVGWVPLEEYAFFAIETIMVGGIWVVMDALMPQQSSNKAANAPSSIRIRRVGVILMAVVWMVGAKAVTSRQTEYLGLIIIWAVPVLALQWGLGGQTLMAKRSVWVPTVVTSSAILCVADVWAISHALWDIDDQSSVGEIVDYLPFEEALFFLLTSTMCSWGLTLAIAAHQRAVSQDKPLNVIVWEMIAPRGVLRITDALDIMAHMLAACTVFAMWICGVEMPLELQAVALIIATTALGMPHGALDPILVSWSSRSLAIYIALMAAMLLAWAVVPTIALAVFLVLSIAHFGEGDAPLGSMSCGWPIQCVEVFARGGAFLVATSAHRAQVEALFSMLVSGDSIEILMFALLSMRWVHIVAVVVSAVRHASRLEHAADLLGLADLIVTNALFATTPPLVAFTVYFNMFHARRHVVRVYVKLARPSSASWSNGIVCGGAAAGASAFVWWSSDGLSLGHGIGGAIRPVFILLSTLAVPHAVLVVRAAIMTTVRRCVR